MTESRDVTDSPGVTNSGDCILYITADGILEPLGQSQVLKYVFGLQSRGLRHVILSLEKPRDLENSARLESFRQQLQQAGIVWTPLPFRTGGVRKAVSNVIALARAASKLVRQHHVTCIHVRSYLPALAAWWVKSIRHIPYVFDMRGYWVDERREEGRWFTSPLRYRIAKRMERLLIRNAVAVVTLTQLQADDLRATYPEKFVTTPLAVIPTCADYDEFAPSASDASLPPEIRLGLEGKLVVGLVGSINASYKVSESLTLFRYVLEQRADAHLICLTRQTLEMTALVQEAGIPDSACTIADVPHDAMPGWLGVMDWGVLLMNQNFAKRGSMPTKLAEFFAAGVRPIQFGCNDEVAEKVREAGSGIVLTGVSDAELRNAARVIAATTPDNSVVQAARHRTRDYFSLQSGLNRYQKLLESVLSKR